MLAVKPLSDEKLQTPKKDIIWDIAGICRIKAKIFKKCLSWFDTMQYQ